MYLSLGSSSVCFPNIGALPGKIQGFPCALLQCSFRTVPTGVENTNKSQSLVTDLKAVAFLNLSLIFYNLWHCCWHAQREIEEKGTEWRGKESNASFFPHCFQLGNRS